MAKKQGSSKKRKERRIVRNGIANIQCTFNNTIVAIADMEGNTLCWASSGSCGYKGSKKSTPFAATMVAKAAAEKSREFGVENIEVRVKGPGSGRESAIRSLQSNGLNIIGIQDITPIPHNGCRARKRRRV